MKKYLRFYYTALMICAALTSCNTDLDNISIRNVEKPKGVKVSTSELLTCTEENLKETAVTISWNAANLGENVAINYIIQFDLENNNFESPYEIIIGGGNPQQKVLTYNDLNTAMYRLGQAIDNPTKLEVRIVATPLSISGNPELEKYPSEDKAVLTVSSFAPEPVHMLGSMFGPAWDPNFNYYGWDPTNYRYVMFRDDPLGINVFVSNFKEYNTTIWTGQFVFFLNSYLNHPTWWDYQIRKSGQGMLSTTTGGNIEEILTPGYYKIEADLNRMTYSIEEYDTAGKPIFNSVALTGSALNSDVVMDKTFYDDYMWSADNIDLSVGTINFKVNGSTNWGGGETFPWGIAEESDAAINIPKAGTYFIRFSGLTGHYIFYRK